MNAGMEWELCGEICRAWPVTDVPAWRKISGVKSVMDVYVFGELSVMDAYVLEVTREE